MTETTTYFNTPSEEWSFLNYYRHRRNENNFTFSFRKESFLLKKNLESRQKILKAKQLLEAFKNHRQHNEEVNIFWNEIELMYLEYEKNLRTKRCHVNISSKTQDMMENMAEETVKAHLATTKINISGPMRFCPYCGSEVASSDAIEFEEFESDSDEPVESDHETDEIKDDENPPKIDKLAFREAHYAIPDNTKMHLKSGKIVEDVLFDFAKDMEHEHHAHSYIINFDDENVKALFTQTEWNELTEDRIRIPGVPREIGEELEWIQMAVRTLVNLYENIDAPLIRNQYENWFTVAFFRDVYRPLYEGYTIVHGY
ncbi:hypothetical protein C1646_813355 [Rhizophagus diaphanus]|nr:hypothetical protein C1646_813355 [Rhizophagus diaphanus] [Rhizophagus sp. MUCL 43196]